MTPVVDYGTPERPNLEEISKVAAAVLREYEFLIGKYFHFDKEFLLQHTPEKTTTARTVTDEFLDGEKVGDLYVILFAPGDGTGKGSEGDYAKFAEYALSTPQEEAGNPTYAWKRDFPQQRVLIPPEYQYGRDNKPERILPRNKKSENVLLEACFPLATVEGKYRVERLIALEQITVDNQDAPTRLVKGMEIGSTRDFSGVFTSVFESRKQPLPVPELMPIYLTCGYRRNGQRFGDPHATYFNPKSAEGRPNLMQVAGFLAAEKADNPLCTLLDKVAIAPQ